MSERLPEVFLATAEREAQGRMYASGSRYLGADDEVGRPIPDPDPFAVVALVAEVRRLRGLILAAQDDPSREDQTGKPTGPLYDALMQHKAALHGLEAEARAIRDEQRTENGTG